MIELTERTSTSMRELAERARRAAVGLRTASPKQKTNAIRAMARGIVEQGGRILEANARDVAAAKAAGLGSAKIDRLVLNEKRLGEVARGLEDVAELPDPVGQVFDESTVAS